MFFRRLWISALGFVYERKDIRILKRHVDELNELFVSGAEAWAARKNVWAQEFVILGVILEIAYENAWKSLGVDFFSLFSWVSWVKLAHGQDMEGDTANRKHQETWWQRRRRQHHLPLCLGDLTELVDYVILHVRVQRQKDNSYLDMWYIVIYQM